MEQYKTLVLGAGKYNEPLAKGNITRVDIIQTGNIDTLWDLNCFPYPGNDKTFDLVVARDLLEHLLDPLGVMEEIHRLLKDKGKAFVRVIDEKPENVWADLTHLRGFTPDSFDYFDPSTWIGNAYDYYTKGKFKIESKTRNNKGIDFWFTKI